MSRRTDEQMSRRAKEQMGLPRGSGSSAHLLIRSSALLLICSSLLGCGSTSAPAASGTMEAQWTGADTGSLRATATAQWCAERRFGEILGIQGDTGIAIAIRHADSLTPGRYAALLPDSADTATTSATVALRFLSRTAVSGYQSDSGSVRLQRDEAGRLGVDFD